MRTTTAAERLAVSGLRPQCYSKFEVQDADGVYRDYTGYLRTDWFTGATIAESQEQNTMSLNATLLKETGTLSLSPFRSDSLVNRNAGGTYANAIDAWRKWKLSVAVMREGYPPTGSDWKEMCQGRIDTIEWSGDQIIITGRGEEAVLLDFWISAERQYGSVGGIAMETTLQSQMDDNLGTGTYTLYTPVSPGYLMNTWTQPKDRLFPSMVAVSDKVGDVLRFRYDSANTNRLTLLSPNRTATPGSEVWTIGPAEYTAIRKIAIDKQGIRNFIKLRFAHATLGTQTVIYPHQAGVGTVSCAAGVATFSSSQAAYIKTTGSKTELIAGGISYTVNTFNGTTSATLISQLATGGVPTFGAVAFTLHDTISLSGTGSTTSIDRFGRVDLEIDLAFTSQVNDPTKAQSMADAIGADTEFPPCEQEIETIGFWFVQLHDYGRFLANGVDSDTDLYAGVTSIRHEIANGTIRSTIGVRGKPSGKYTGWRYIPGAVPTDVSSQLDRRDTTSLAMRIRRVSEAGGQMVVRIEVVSPNMVNPTVSIAYDAGGLTVSPASPQTLISTSAFATTAHVDFTITQPTGVSGVPRRVSFTASTSGYVDATDGVDVPSADFPTSGLTGTIDTAQITNLAVTAAKLGALAVEAGKIAANAVTATELAALAVTTAKIAAGAVTSAEIGANAVIAGKIAANAVTATELAALAVTTAKIAASAVTSAEIGASAVIAGKIAANAVTATEIAALAVTTAKIDALAITTAKIAAAAVTATELGALAVTTAKLDALAVTTAKIAALAVTSSELAASSVIAGKIAALTIVAGDIAANTITAAKIAAGTITTTEIAATTILAGNIASGAITTAKIAALNVTAAEIAANTITAAKIAALTITAAEIAANTITAAKIAADTITASEIAANAITSSELAANSVIAGKIAALTIVAADIAASTITGAKIAANTITAANITADTITAAEIAANAITASELAANSVTAAKIGAGEVTAGKIAALSIVAGDIAATTITGGKLVANTITAAQIAAGTISATEIATGAITTIKIGALQVTAAEIAANTITAAKIAANTISANEIVANTITSGQTAGRNRAKVYNSGAQSIPNTTLTALNFDTESYDVGSLHDTVTNNNRFTVPTGGDTGVWILTLQVQWGSNATGIRIISIYNNGTGGLGRLGIVQATSVSNLGGEIQNLTVFINAPVVGSWFDAEVSQTSGGALNANGAVDATWFIAQHLW